MWSKNTEYTFWKDAISSLKLGQSCKVNGKQLTRLVDEQIVFDGRIYLIDNFLNLKVGQ